MKPSHLPLHMASKVTVDGDGCWVWGGAVQSKGYGCGGGKDGPWLAHRRAYEVLVGPLEPGVTIDHLCRNKTCINPGHMEAVSRAVNTRRGVDYAIAIRPDYPCGHERSEDNTLTKNRSNGQINRTCKECNRASTRRIKAEQNAALAGRMAA